MSKKNYQYSDMVRAFQIFKEGMTTDWVTILIPSRELTDEFLTKKMNFYASLGYKIKPLL